jgi:transposase InsO family protein
VFRGRVPDRDAHRHRYGCRWSHVWPNRHPWATRQDLRIAIVTWIERTYHRRRRQDALGRLTPIEYETIMTTPATQAA